MTVDTLEVEGTLEAWDWYCRIDGAKGTYYTRAERDQAALQHRDHDCQTAGRQHPCWAEYGHLVHVWRY